MMLEEYKCEGEIEHIHGKNRAYWQVDGKRDMVPEDAFRECGDRVLCDNCSELARLLGNSWAYPVAVEIADAILKELEKGSIPGVRVKATQVHMCGESCRKALTRRQIEGAAKRELRGSIEI